MHANTVLFKKLSNRLVLANYMQEIFFSVLVTEGAIYDMEYDHVINLEPFRKGGF